MMMMNCTTYWPAWSPVGILAPRNTCPKWPAVGILGPDLVVSMVEVTTVKWISTYRVPVGWHNSIQLILIFWHAYAVFNSCPHSELIYSSRKLPYFVCFSLTPSPYLVECRPHKWKARNDKTVRTGEARADAAENHFLARVVHFYR